MNSTHRRHWCFGASAGLALAGTAAMQAQTLENTVFCQFDDTDTSINFVKWWGDMDVAQEWDGSMNATTTLAPNTAGSGALKVTLDWTQPNKNQLMIWQEVDGQQSWWVDPAQRVNGFFYDLSFDIRFDPASAQTADGDYGHIIFGVSTPSWNQVPVLDFPKFPVTNGWMHVVCRIDPKVANIDQITAVLINYPWQPNALNGIQTFWIDNLIFEVNPNKNLQPPTLALKAAGTPGLQVTSTGPGDQWQRQNIVTAANSFGYSWYGMGDTPVTYSFTLAKFPDPAAAPDFEAHMFLVQHDSLPTPVDWNETYSAIDWNGGSVVNVALRNNAAGGVDFSFAFKTNRQGNGINVNVGSMHAPSAIGTWSVTFLNNTNVTLKAADGTSANFGLEEDMAMQFAGDMMVDFGLQKNQLANIGQMAVFSRIQMINVATPLDETFPGPGLNPDPTTPTWRLAGEAAAIQVVPPDSLFWLTWTLPDLGFGVQISPDLKAGSWTDPGLGANAVVDGSMRKVLVPKSVAPASGPAFFRMVKP